MSLHPMSNVPVSPYSSLAGAAPSSIFQTSRAIVPANRVLLPQPIWTPSGKLDSPPGNAPHITFDMLGAPAGFGISVMDVAARGSLSSWIQRADDPLCLNADKISFRIIWPGYEHCDFNRSIPITQNTTRGQLAMQVSKLIMNYLSKLESERPSSPACKWRVGPDNVSLEHIVLASVFTTHTNTFQAVIHLQFR